MESSENKSATVELTPVARAKAGALLAGEGRDDLALRVAVQPGGCSGLRYQLFFDQRQLPGDVISELTIAPEAADAVGRAAVAGSVLRVVVDRMSAPYLSGAVVDYTDTIEKQGFSIDNPNAGGSCACGDSFH